MRKNFVQGNNSIYMSGHNVVTDSFNSIKLDIQNAELPEEHKELIKQFLDGLTSGKNKDKRKYISEFLSKITTGTLTSAASKLLVELLFHLANALL